MKGIHFQFRPGVQFESHWQAPTQARDSDSESRSARPDKNRILLPIYIRQDGTEVGCQWSTFKFWSD